jgi:hypothetical protein
MQDGVSMCSGFNCFRKESMTGFCEYENEISGSIKMGIP